MPRSTAGSKSPKRSPKRAPATRTEQRAHSAEQKLAAKIAKLRDAGRKYDGEGGICSMPGMPKSAIRCRALLRKHGLDAKRIGPSYERTPEFRAAESERRISSAAKPKPKPRKRTAAKPKPKRAAKPTAAPRRKRTARS